VDAARATDRARTDAARRTSRLIIAGPGGRRSICDEEEVVDSVVTTMFASENCVSAKFFSRERWLQMTFRYVSSFMCAALYY